MIVETVCSGGCRSHLIGSPAAGVAAVIDPKREAYDELCARASAAGLRIVYAIDTHTHADHVSASQRFAHACGARIVMHDDAPAPFADMRVRHGDAIRVGDVELSVLHTPGHTADSICLLTGGVLFTGDTLLIGSTGRTDLPTGDPGALYDSLFNTLAGLPRSTRILPAHNYNGRTQSTIGDEFAANPRLQIETREAFVDLMTKTALPPPALLDEALRLNGACPVRRCGGAT